MSAFRVVLITVPQEKAEELSQKMVEGKLAACVNIIDTVKSVYHWKGGMKKDYESLLIAKTTTKRVERLIKFIREAHSYEIPEVLALTVTEGNPDYLDWLDKETSE
ncbi:MAG: divalent-cation tolerance protein CutA [Candidatus Zixiibacteriota bacterium]